MNQVKIINKNEEIPKHTLSFDLDEEQRVLLNIDINYIERIAMAHLKNKIVKTKIKQPQMSLFHKESDIVVPIVTSYISLAIVNVENTFKAYDVQKALQLFNSFNLEIYLLSMVIDKLTDEVFEALKKDELN